MFWFRDILWLSHYILSLKGKVWVITNGNKRIENKGNTFSSSGPNIIESLHFVVKFDPPQFSQFELLLLSCAAQAASACIYEF